VFTDEIVGEDKLGLIHMPFVLLQASIAPHFPTTLTSRAVTSQSDLGPVRVHNMSTHLSTQAGLHSSWVTDIVLAMARPWQQNLEAGALEQLKAHNFGMILNLQETGEHSACGPGLLAASGFSYAPETFMRAGIGYYHMPWPDMSVPSLPAIMRIVQVMQHVAVNEGRKIAVHCHAGLGRTGLAIACFLVFSRDFIPADAIAAVRTGRPGALQTDEQVAFVHIFRMWLLHLRYIFHPSFQADATENRKSVEGRQLPWDEKLRIRRGMASQIKSLHFRPAPPASLEDYVDRQRHLLHGQQLLHFWNVPKLLVDCLRVRGPRTMNVSYATLTVVVITRDSACQ
jgi:hypothetical protein